MFAACDFMNDKDPHTEHRWKKLKTLTEASWDNDGSDLYICEDCGTETTIAVMRGCTEPAHNFKNSDICEYCDRNITDISTLTCDMSASSNDDVMGYIVSRQDNNYDVYISGTGAIKDYTFSSTPFESIKDAVVNVYIKNGITSIGYWTFCDCTNLTNVTIPNSIINIDANAFVNCKSLVNITIPNSVTSIGWSAFQGCSSLTNMTIPDGVTEIPHYTFYNCSNLTNIDIPSSVTTIGDSAFGNCISLSCVNIPDGVTAINSSAFANCSSLSSITIPDSILSIASHTFNGCNKLEYNVVNNIKYLGNKLTPYLVAISPLDSNATNMTIHSDCKVIYQQAFKNCDKLKQITIPDGTTYIGESAFYGCSKLTSLSIPNSVTTIAPYTFYGCKSLTKISIPDGITSVGSHAFYLCKSLEFIHIPDNAITIGDWAYAYCSSLKLTIIPRSVTSIGQYAFGYCNDLYHVSFEDSNNWYYTIPNAPVKGAQLILSNSSTNATYLKSTYSSYYWYKNN